MNGAAYALDYNVLFTRMGHMKLSDNQHEATFQDIRHLEAESLRLMAESNE